MDAREQLILPYIKDKIVLDVGCGDINDRFLHRFICVNAREVTGLEISQKRINKLNALGYFNIFLGDTEIFEFKKKFDVIVAGDLIEHLGNPKLFLLNMKNYLDKDGVFIINTPNIYSINNVLLGLIKGGDVKAFHEHTMGFTEDNLKGLIGDDFVIDKVVYFNYDISSFRNKVIKFFCLFSFRWREHMLFVLKNYNGLIEGGC